MKRIFVLILFTACLFSIRAQSRDELIEAYRRGTLTASQIENLKRQYGITDIPTANIMSDMQSRRRDIQNRDIPGRVGQSPISSGEVSVAASSRPQALEYQSAAYPEQDSLATDQEPMKIFGHEMFRHRVGGFEQNMNIATPENYVLGAGDEIIVDLWGNSQSSMRMELSPDGYVIVSEVGPVMLAGLTIKQAERRLRNAMSAVYEGLTTGDVEMMLSLGRIRTIMVDVAGEVSESGTYALPSLSTLFDALRKAGGVSDIGSVRRIGLYRSGKQVAEIDLYKYIVSGDNRQDIPLRDGDLIIIEPHECVVKISGDVRRPMRYELSRGESLSDAIGYAGGFSSDANRQTVGVVRRRGGRRESHTVDSAAFRSFMLEDGDSVIVGGGINRYANRVELQGAVMRPGYYAIDEDTQTLKQLLHHAEGLREDAFMPRAVLYREKDDFTREVVAIDLQGLMSGEIEDITLRPNDRFVILSIDDMREEFTVGIFGAVSHSGDYPYAENMTIEDLIVAAGGLRESASTANITVVRRIKSPHSLRTQEQLFEIFVVDVNRGLSVKEGEFRLRPFDQVFVRRSPVYITQSSVTVEGEVAFAGRYPLSHRNMRLSEVVADAGYPTSGAFIEGAYLLRKMTAEERMQSDALQKLIDMQRGRGGADSLRMNGINLSEVYSVGINLAEALAYPGSDADVVLRDGDVISIPQYNGTVRVMGAVLYPNSVTYVAGKRLKYYVDSAGGFDNRARRRGAFVIYMNGMVSSGLSSKIRPGCIVVVPSKLPVSPLRWNDILGLASSSASTAALVMSAINVAK